MAAVLQSLAPGCCCPQVTPRASLRPSLKGGSSVLAGEDVGRGVKFIWEMAKLEAVMVPELGA